METQKCRKCGQEFPHTLEYFKPSKACRDGLTSTCRKCHAAVVNAWKDKHRDRLRRRSRERYAEHYGEVIEAKRRARLARKPVRERAKIMRLGILDRSRRWSLPFDTDVFTVEYIYQWLLRQPECPACGKTFHVGWKHNGGAAPTSPSLDRIHPERGYVVGNVALICWRCNNLKRDASPEELERLTAWMRTVW